MLPKAPTMDAVALRKLIKRLLQELAPVEAAERNQRARDNRYVAITPASDGMAFLEALMPAEDLTALNTALNVAAADAKRADAAAGLPARTKDHRRADTLADLGWTALAACADGSTAVADQGGRHTGAAAHASPGTNAPAKATTGASRYPGPGTTAAAGHAATTHAGAGPIRDAAHADPPRHAGPGTTAPGNAATAYADASATSDAAHAGAPTAPREVGAKGVAVPRVSGTTPHPAAGAPGDPSSATSGAPPHARPADNPADGPPGRSGSAGERPPARPDGRTGDSDSGDSGSGGPDSGGPDSGGSGSRGATAGSGPRRRPVSVHVTIPFTSLAGLTDEPGELEGYGPIPAHVARKLAAEGVWTWLRTDPATGRLLDHGRKRYRPTKALADFVTARDRSCRAPGCHLPARSCDVDHVVPFAAGGRTDRANCHTLCALHHRLKHHGRWDVEREPDGTTRWRSPTGHRYVREPDPCHGSRWDSVEDTG